VPATPSSDPKIPASTHLVIPVHRWWLWIVIAAGVVLVLISAVLQLAKDRGFVFAALQLDRLLNIDEDLSVLNWITASMFLLAGLVASAVAARQTSPFGWFATGAVLALVSLDEAAGVHDPVTVFAEAQARAGGVGLVGVLVVAVVAGSLVARFLFGLAPPVRWRAAAALGLLLLAAIGIDSLGPNLVNDPAARLKPGYLAKASVEEILELGASVLVLDAMLVAALKR